MIIIIISRNFIVLWPITTKIATTEQAKKSENN